MAVLQMALANIERVDIVTEETATRVFSFDTANEASVEAQVSAGTETELRVKNQILAQNITEDIVKGFNITLNDSTFAPDVFALVDGGTSTVADDEFQSYTAPVAGQVSARVKSTLIVYAAEKDYDGNSLSYTAFAFPHASGTPTSVSLKDGEFYAPSYTLKSRPSKGDSPMKIDRLPSLPIVVKAAGDLPESPVSGKTVILVGASGISGIPDTLAVGSIAKYNGTAYAAV